MSFTTIYDDMIRAAVTKYMPPGWDWLRHKAQLIQESQLDPNAESGAGAQGIGQFMPETWGEAQAHMPLPDDSSPFQPEFAIPASVWYDRKLWDGWTNPHRSDIDRWHLSLASYNAGFGNIEHAQHFANGALDYETIISQLHKVTGDSNAAQTRGYVTHIEKYYDQLKAGA